MNVALICIGLLGLLLFVLGLMVSLGRTRGEVTIGHSTDPTDGLHKLVRAHGNTAEFTAALALLIWIVGSLDPSAWDSFFMIGATVSRYLIVIGMLMSTSLARPQPLRVVGALGTYGFGVALSISVIFQAL